MGKRYAWLFLRLIISVGLLLFVLQNINLARSWSLIQQAPWPWLAAATGLQLGSVLIASSRWFLLSRVLRWPGHSAFYIGSYFKGMFCNQALPTSIGGDVARIMDLRHLRDGPSAFSNVLLDRLIGLWGMLLLSLGGAILSYHLLSELLMLAFVVAAIILIASMLLLALAQLPLKKSGWWQVLPSLAAQLRLLCQRMSQLISQLCLAIATHFCAIGALYCLGNSLRLELPLSLYLVLVPPAMILALLPISIAGWGLREGALVALFLQVDADPSSVTSMSLLYGVILLLVSVPGLPMLWQKQS